MATRGSNRRSSPARRRVTSPRSPTSASREPCFLLWDALAFVRRPFLPYRCSYMNVSFEERTMRAASLSVCSVGDDASYGVDDASEIQAKLGGVPRGDGQYGHNVFVPTWVTLSSPTQTHHSSFTQNALLHRSRTHYEAAPQPFRVAMDSQAPASPRSSLERLAPIHSLYSLNLHSLPPPDPSKRDPRVRCVAHSIPER